MDEVERIDRLERLLQDAQTDVRRQLRAVRRSAEAWARNQLVSDPAIVGRAIERGMANWAEANPGLNLVGNWVRGGEPAGRRELLQQRREEAAEGVIRVTKATEANGWSSDRVVTPMPAGAVDTGVLKPEFRRVVLGWTPVEECERKTDQCHGCSCVPAAVHRPTPADVPAHCACGLPLDHGDDLRCVWKQRAEPRPTARSREDGV
jgi:hypothetical protein